MTPERAAAIDAFLQANGWGDATYSFLSGDASFRSYQRVVDDKRSAVLMDAPPAQEPLSPFIKMDEYLIHLGYSAPIIYARDNDQGFLLLEDLGDALFSRYLARKPAEEAQCYLTAADMLIDLHRQTQLPDFVDTYSTEIMLRESALFTDWYLAPVVGQAEAAHARIEFLRLWKLLIERMPYLSNVVVLRDFHADNLLWLPKRDGVAKIGLLDFQDALIGSPVYDLVSLLEDARRDVQPETSMTVLNHYIQQMQWDFDSFMACYHLMGAQRNMKIIGIFARLAMRDAKPHYLHYLPRVWKHLHHDLQHPILRPIKNWLNAVLPQEAQQDGATILQLQPKQGTHG